DDFSAEIGWLANRGVFWNREDPSNARESLLRVNQFGEFFDTGSGFYDPIVSRDSRVEGAGFDVASHFLRPYKQPFNFLIVDGRHVAAGTDSDFPSWATEEVDRRLLQAAFWDAEFQAAHRLVSWP